MSEYIYVIVAEEIDHSRSLMAFREEGMAREKMDILNEECLRVVKMWWSFDFTEKHAYDPEATEFTNYEVRRVELR